MTTYNTGNPIGSTEVKDLYDDAQNFDTLSTTTTLESVPDRLGVPRMSLHGFEQEAKRRFESIKFQSPIPYAPGIEVTTSSLTVDYLGVIYYALPSALPFTTGAWNPAQWSPVQNTYPGRELLVFDDYASASAAAATLPDGQMVDVESTLLRYDIESGSLVNERHTTPFAIAGGFTRSAQSKLSELPSVKDFGGKGDGITDDSTSAVLMGSEVGFVRFTRGAYLLNSVTIDFPIVFEDGAYVLTPSGQTTTITNTVSSTNQWIFRGDGVYSLGNDLDSGENARKVHASWFGAFPNPSPGTDQGPAISKAFASMGNTRESIVEFDIGNYNLSTAVPVTRGGHVKGDGTRRTVFKLDSDGFDAFYTLGTACKFSGIQFEIHSSSIATRSSAYIRLDHEQCDVDLVNLGNSSKGIISNGASCRIRNLAASWTNPPAAGSSLVEINAENCTVENIDLNTTSAHGPTSIVHVKSSASMVKNINHITPSISVLVDASTSNASRNTISGIRSNAFTGTTPAACIKLITSSTFSIEDTVIYDVLVNSYPSTAIVFEQNSSGFMMDISLDNINVSGSSGVGVQFTRTSGTLRDIQVGSTVNVRSRAVPYGYSGTTSNIKISPISLPSVLPGYCYDFSIADDGVGTIVLNRSIFTGWFLITVGNAERAMYTIRAASSPSVVSYGSPSTNMATAITSLSGTTGTDGKFTVGITDGVIYLENRLGASQRVSATLLTGVS